MRFIENLVLPPVGLILLGLAGLLLLARRKRRWGHALVASSLLGLYLVSTPLTAGALLAALDRYPALPPTGALPEAQAIVVLGAGLRWGAIEYGADTVTGTALERLRYGARLAERTALPVLVTGFSAEEMAETLETSFHVHVRWKAGGANTWGNAEQSAQVLLPEGIRRVFLVTDFWHMPRSVATFHKAGFETVPAPVGFTGNKRPFILALLPRTDSLVRVKQALHEGVGRVWYRLRYGV